MSTGKKKAYIAVMSLGALALIVDRFFMGTVAPMPASASEMDDTLQTNDPDDANADAPRDARSSTNALSKNASSAAAISIPELAFPRNLIAVDLDAPLRDLFARPKSAESGSDLSDAEQQASAAGESRDLGRAAFARKHRVDGVMSQEGLKIVIVNGQWMRIGESLDGCTLQRINRESAVFQCRDGEAELSPFPKSENRDR